MEAISRTFEQEIDVLEEVLKQIQQGDGFYLGTSPFYNAEHDGYVPYCEIKFESSPDIRGDKLEHSGVCILEGSNKDVAWESLSSPGAMTSSVRLGGGSLHIVRHLGWSPIYMLYVHIWV